MPKRAGEVVALAILATNKCMHQFQLTHRVNAFRRDLQAQVMGHGHDYTDHRSVLWIRDNIHHEFLVELG